MNLIRRPMNIISALFLSYCQGAIVSIVQLMGIVYS